jgi:hypothetical protein
MRRGHFGSQKVTIEGLGFLATGCRPAASGRYKIQRAQEVREKLAELGEARDLVPLKTEGVR